MIYVSTHAGKLHEHSEDSVIVGTEVISDKSGTYTVPDCGFICVADGVGGISGGAVASRFILEKLASHETDTDLKAYLSAINDELILSAKSTDSPDMASTLTGFFYSDNRTALVHIGNTRAYVRQGKYLKQITSDHTTYNWLKSSGQTDAAEYCNRNEITNCFGGGNPSLFSKIFTEEQPHFAEALLTSDGVHEYVDIDTLEDIMNSEANYEEKCEMIIQKALDADSSDDMTIVIIINDK